MQGVIDNCGQPVATCLLTCSFTAAQPSKKHDPDEIWETWQAQQGTESEDAESSAQIVWRRSEWISNAL